MDHSLSVPASLPSQDQKKLEFSNIESFQIPECMETEAENQKPLQSLLADDLSASSQASLGEKHIPQYERIDRSPPNTLKHPSSDTSNYFLPKRILTDMSSHKTGLDKYGVTEDAHTSQNVRTKTHLENLNKERMDLEEPQRVGEFSLPIKTNTDYVFDMVGDKRLRQATTTDSSPNIDEALQPNETGKGLDGPDTNLQNLTELSEVDPKIDDDRDCWQKGNEVGEGPSNDSLIGNHEICDAEIKRFTEQQVEDFRNATSTKTSINSQEGEVLTSEKELKKNSLSSNFYTHQVEFTTSDTGEKSEVAPDADHKQKNIHCLLRLKCLPISRIRSSESDPYDSYLSPVATLFELHRELIASGQDPSLKMSAKLEDNNQSVTSQEENVQLMESSKECSENNTLNECESEIEKEPMLTADTEISSEKDNNVEGSVQFTTKLSTHLMNDEPEMLVQKTTDVDGDFILLSKDLTNQMDISSTNELLETQDLSPQNLEYASDNTEITNGQMSQTTGTHLVTHNVGCSTEISASSMVCEGTVEAHVNQPDWNSLESPAELRLSDLSNQIFPVANIERIRTSGFTHQEAVEALERCHGNTDLALLVLLARGIVVPI
ncbi:protein DDI1 homolog 2 isoform X1 [Narcine bancroftii]|uniref:protein DDI1 homolog 2 isoform X1 n=1 Tax=Narcine bancroftii TaxID=1343680 RepID=UPI003831A495